MIKDKLHGKIMSKFVAFRDKRYAYRKPDKMLGDKHCKGTKKCVVAKSLSFDDYKTCMFDGKTVCRKLMLFENKKQVFMVRKHKKALNRDDGRRKIQASVIMTLARRYST